MAPGRLSDDRYERFATPHTARVGLAPRAATSLLHTGAMPATVLVIADQLDISALISRCLAGTGVRTLIANDVRHAGLILERERCDAVVLDLAAPGHCDAVMQWLKRDPSRAAMAIVRVSALARHGGAPRGEVRADLVVPKPFAPRQIADAVRTALVRRSVRLSLNAA
jgi:DNA-binding response OmpR family regulator